MVHGCFTVPKTALKNSCRTFLPCPLMLTIVRALVALVGGRVVNNFPEQLLSSYRLHSLLEHVHFRWSTEDLPLPPKGMSSIIYRLVQWYHLVTFWWFPSSLNS